MKSVVTGLVILLAGFTFGYQLHSFINRFDPDLKVFFMSELHNKSIQNEAINIIQLDHIQGMLESGDIEVAEKYIRDSKKASFLMLNKVNRPELKHLVYRETSVLVERAEKVEKRGFD